MNQIIVTVSLNKGAYLIYKGAELLGYMGKNYYNCKLLVKVDEKVFKDARKGEVRYQDYMKVRNKLKMKIKKKYNIYH